MIFCFLTVMVMPVLANDLLQVPPEEVGFSSDRLERVRDYFNNRVKNGALPGAVMMVSRHGKIVLYDAVGYANLEAREKLRTDHIFRMQSMTKPIAATALMMLYEEGRFQMSDPLHKYLPELKGIKVEDGMNDDGSLRLVRAKRPPNMLDVLRHTAGFSSDGDKKYAEVGLNHPEKSTLESMITKLAKIPLEYQPGEKWVYSISSNVQARLVEVLSGVSFDEFLQKRLFDKLRMNNTGFTLTPDKKTRLGPQYKIDDQGLLKPLLNDKYPERHPYHYLRPVRFFSGSSGLVSTAEDYWRYAQMMLDGGKFDDARILGPRTIEFMTQDPLQNIPGMPSSMGYGLGFGVMKTQALSGSMAPGGTYFWGGGFGTRFWIDPKEDIVAIFLSQTVPNQIAAEVENIYALVYSALIE